MNQAEKSPSTSATTNVAASADTAGTSAVPKPVIKEELEPEPAWANLRTFLKLDHEFGKVVIFMGEKKSNYRCIYRSQVRKRPQPKTPYSVEVTRSTIARVKMLLLDAGCGACPVDPGDSYLPFNFHYLVF